MTHYHVLVLITNDRAVRTTHDILLTTQLLSCEQLCINFANEKLHQLYLLTMFKAEQALCTAPCDALCNARCDALCNALCDAACNALCNAPPPHHAPRPPLLLRR